VNTPQLRLPTLDGQRFDQLTWSFAGGLSDTIRTEQDAADVRRAKLDTYLDLRVRVRVSGKGWKVKHDADGMPTRTLTVTLAVDSFEFDTA
jgi:hypothetical protein